MDKPISEVQPLFRLVVDEKPPSGSVWMVNQYGAGFAGYWYPECGAAAWCPLPKLTPEQKARLRELEAQGIDVTRVM